MSSCRQCQNHLTSNIKQPKTIKPNLIHLFQEAVADFCIHAGKITSSWLIVTWTGQQSFISMNTITMSYLITALTTWFSQTAVPDVLWSNVGLHSLPISFSVLQRIGDSYSIHLPYTSTLYNAQSNGKAESTIKTINKIIYNTNSLDWLKLGWRKLCTSLLHYHNTLSRKGGLSPAQKLYGCPVQDMLPAHCSKFTPEWLWSIKEVQQQA